MALPRLRPLPGLLLALTVLAELAAVLLSWGLEPAFDTVLYGVFSCALAGSGALVLSRHPRNLIGWLLVGVGLENAVAGELAQGWALHAHAEGLPFGPAADVLAAASWLPQAPAFVLIILLFPTDRMPSPRWWLVFWLSVLGVVLALPGWVLNPESSVVFAGGTNPYAVNGPVTGRLFVVGFTMVALALVAAFVATFGRYRRSSGVERQQVKWFALSTGVLVSVLCLAAPLWAASPVARLAVAVALTMWPVTIGIAVLRYRLYDVDLVISRTFSYAVLSAVLAVVYGVAVVALGAAVGRDSAWVTAIATLLAAAAVKLLHRRVQDVVDRRFRPERHEALGVVARFVEELRHDRVEPESVEDALRQALRAPSLELRFVPPDQAAVEGPVGGPGGRAEPASGGEVHQVLRGGTVIAEVRWSPKDDSERMLLPELLAAGALPLEMARLRVELRRRLAEVDESRARIVAVADEERRRLERDLHDGAQQRLVSIGLSLRHAQHVMTADPAEARRTLDDAVVQVYGAIEELRELAHGLRPSALQAGLGAALRELAGRSPVRVEVSAGPERFPADVEATAYFVACEGLTNAVKHARADEVAVSVTRRQDTVVVSVVDDGVGGAAIDGGSGLTGLKDRVSASGGRLHLDSAHGRGTVLRAELPCVS